MRSAGIGEGTGTYTWSFPICPHRVSIDLSVVEALQAELADSHESLYGLLFGEVRDGITHVCGWHTLPDLTIQSVGEALPRFPGAVGYYTIRDGSAFILTPAEAAIANEHFEPGSVVLLVERRRKGPAEATFFFWRGDVFVHNLPLPFPFHAGLLSGQTSYTAAVPARAAAKPKARIQGRSNVLRTALLALGAVAAGGLFAAYFRDGHTVTRRPAPGDVAPISEAAAWIPTEPKRDLELSWDARSDAVTNAVSGVLRIEDGGVTRQMTLGPGELLVGSVLYAPASERIRVELTTTQRDGRSDRSAVTAQIADFSPTAPNPAPKPEPPVAAAKVEPPPAKEQTPPPTAEKRPTVKRFTWTATDRAVAPPPAPENLPQAVPAPINPDLAAANLPPTVLPAPSIAPAPPPKAPASVKTALPHSGRMIWIGNLPRKGVLELDGKAATIGSISGALPGVPVNLSVTPAEFGDDGLLVYTTDPKLQNRVEPPSAGNGWNKITFLWDPERVRQIEILEPPNQSNSFSRLALRSEARRCSMLFINWTVR